MTSLFPILFLQHMSGRDVFSSCEFSFAFCARFGRPGILSVPFEINLLGDVDQRPGHLSGGPPGELLRPVARRDHNHHTAIGGGAFAP